MAEWIPLFQTLVWPIFVIALIIYFHFLGILQLITERIKSGAPVKAGPSGIEIGAIPKEIENLPAVSQKSLRAGEAAEPTDWRHKRAEEYKRVEGYMLVHVYRPSVVQEQEYDIFLFVVRHQKGTDGPPQRQLDEIEKAEFYFGESWGNDVFPVKNIGAVLGVRTRAWGTFLACCRVTFKDNAKEPIVLFRYVDFHMLQDNPDTT